MSLALTILEIREKLLLKYPQLNNLVGIDNVLPATIDLFIEDAVNTLSIDENKWGNLYLSGILLLSAHYLVRGTPGESNSGIVTESGDDANRTKYHSSSVKSLGTYGSTKYGVEFEALEERVLSNWARNSNYFEVGYFVQ